MIFADFVQSTGEKRVDIGGKIILESYKSDFNELKDFVEDKMKKYEVIKAQFNSDMYTQEYRVKEITKATEIIDTGIKDFISKIVEKMTNKYEVALKQPKVKDKNEEVSKNNLTKISALGDLSEDEIKEVFEISKDKDINVIMLLQIQAERKGLIILSEEIKEHIEEFTNVKALEYMKKEIEEMESLKEYLQCSIVESYGLDDGCVIGVEKIMCDYIEQIDKVIKSL